MSVTTRRIAVLGSGGVGKSCLTLQYVSEKFMEEYDPTIEDTYRKYTEIDGRSFMLDILDTAGQEEYSSFRNMYITRGQAFILVYAVTQKASMRELKDIWVSVVQIKNTDVAPVCLLGNKCDLEEQRDVTEEAGRKMQELNHWPLFFEVSAKTGKNVAKAFESLALESLNSIYSDVTASEEDGEGKKKKKKAGKAGCVML